MAPKSLVAVAIGEIRWRRATLASCRPCRMGGGVVYQRVVAAPDHPGWNRARYAGGDLHYGLVWNWDGVGVVSSC